jgi:DNA adenine methylase
MKIDERRKVDRSPFFYVGDKYKLLPQILPLFPAEINRLIEPFVGGGSVFLNTETNQVLANDLDLNVIQIHRMLYGQGNNMESFIDDMTRLAKKYKLSCSYLGDSVPEDLRLKYPKTYFAQVNRDGFTKLKEKFNSSATRDPLELYVLMVYGFNRMLRFNKQGSFNIPVGNVDFNPNVVKALRSYSQNSQSKKVDFLNQDFETFLKEQTFRNGDLLYVDPPYLITGSEYNKSWSDESEHRLYEILDELDSQNVKFALSNVVTYGEKKNLILKSWMKKYQVHVVSSNYINYFDNGKKEIKEVLVCNYV